MTSKVFSTFKPISLKLQNQPPASDLQTNSVRLPLALNLSERYAVLSHRDYLLYKAYIQSQKGRATGRKCHEVRWQGKYVDCASLVYNQI